MSSNGSNNGSNNGSDNGSNNGSNNGDGAQRPTSPPPSIQQHEDNQVGHTEATAGNAGDNGTAQLPEDLTDTTQDMRVSMGTWGGFPIVMPSRLILPKIRPPPALVFPVTRRLTSMPSWVHATSFAPIPGVDDFLPWPDRHPLLSPIGRPRPSTPPAPRTPSPTPAAPEPVRFRPVNWNPTPSASSSTSTRTPTPPSNEPQDPNAPNDEPEQRVSPERAYEHHARNLAIYLKSLRSFLDTRLGLISELFFTLLHNDECDHQQVDDAHNPNESEGAGPNNNEQHTYLNESEVNHIYEWLNGIDDDGQNDPNEPINANDHGSSDGDSSDDDSSDDNSGDDSSGDDKPSDDESSSDDSSNDDSSSDDSSNANGNNNGMTGQQAPQGPSRQLIIEMARADIKRNIQIIRDNTAWRAIDLETAYYLKSLIQNLDLPDVNPVEAPPLWL